MKLNLNARFKWKILLIALIKYFNEVESSYMGENDARTIFERKLDSDNSTAPAQPEIFHLSAQIDTRSVCWSFLILCFCTILIEGIVDQLRAIVLNAEHWASILNQVCKELMILGLISFLIGCFKEIPLWTANVSETWNVSLEFSHILLFFIGLSFALLSLAVCGVVVRTSKVWEEIEETSIRDMADFVWKITSKDRLTRILCRFASKYDAVNYVMLKHIFITSRKLPANFSFKTYVQLVMLSNVDSLLNVEMTSWTVLAFITASAAVATYLSPGASIHPRPMKEWEPLDFMYVVYYIAIGCAMLIVEFGVFLVAQRAVSRVVLTEGFQGQLTHERILVCLETCRLTYQPDEEDEKEALEESSRKKGKKEFDEDEEDEEGNIKEQGRGGNPEAKNEEEKYPTLDLSYAFPFQSPFLYGKFNDVFLLLKCLYLALFFVYFASAAGDNGPAIGYPLLLGLLFPTIFSSLVLTPRIFKLEAILNSVAQVKPSMLGRTLELMDAESDDLRAKMSADIRSILGQNRNILRLEKLFRDLDTDDSKTLNAHEFEIGLGKLGIYYSPNKYRTLLRALNVTSEGVTCEQFAAFVYPDDDGNAETDAIWVPFDLQEGFFTFEKDLDVFKDRREKLDPTKLLQLQLDLYYKTINYNPQLQNSLREGLVRKMSQRAPNKPQKEIAEAFAKKMSLDDLKASLRERANASSLHSDPESRNSLHSLLKERISIGGGEKSSFSLSNFIGRPLNGEKVKTVQPTILEDVPLEVGSIRTSIPSMDLNKETAERPRVSKSFSFFSVGAESQDDGASFNWMRGFSKTSLSFQPLDDNETATTKKESAKATPAPSEDSQSVQASRNRPHQVLAEIRLAIGAEAFDHFKKLSHAYRTRKSTAQQYYVASLSIIPPHVWPLFMELANHIPDAAQRDALLQIVDTSSIV